MEFIKVGNVANIHGIKGELSIYPYTDDISNFCKYKKFYIGQNKKCFKVIKLRSHKNMVLALLDGVSTREEAYLLKTFDVYVDRLDLKKLDENSYYIEDLIGIDVIDQNDICIGTLKDVIKYPSSDVYEITTNNGNIYLPAIKEVVSKVDILNKKIYVKVMKGLI